jgi:hypothetical protein
VVLIGLLQLDPTYELVKKYRERISLTNTSRMLLDLTLEVGFVIGSDVNEERRWSFEGSTIDLFAQLADEGSSPSELRLLLEGSDGYFDSSTVLVSHVGSHVYNEMDWCGTHCPLVRLLHLGVTANARGYNESQPLVQERDPVCLY